jgi:hypothetical protein
MDELQRERLLRRMNAPPLPPLEATREFLQGFCADEGSIENIRLSVRRMAAINTRPLRAGLAGIQGLLQNPSPDEGTLMRLVVQDAGCALVDLNEQNCREWLEQIARLLEEELAASAPQNHP